MNDFSILIPIYNSSVHIESSVTVLIDFFQKKSAVFKIFLCDDASADQSWAVLQTIAQRYPQVRLMRNDQNQGLGATLRRLISAADTEDVVYCDIDLPFGVEGVARALGTLADADIAVASRYRGCGNTVAWPRRWMSRGYYFLCRLLFNVTVCDIGSGTVSFKKSKVEALDLRSKRFSIHAELYARAVRHRLRMKEFGFPSVQRPGSFSMLKHGPQVFWDTCRLWRQLFR
ncbi:MAG TPA: glycosyltransferase family 2 protein [Candidatus Bathyarchaeia archaeon]|nr:glycosyltransferase family 2 protein [Candidatus Bathyarchaeia archaeon]